MKRRWAALLVLLLAVPVFAVLPFHPDFPAAWTPWAPLRLSDKPNFLTAYKISRLRKDPRLCRAVLAQTDLVFTPVPDHRTGPGCAFQNAVRVTGADIRFMPGFTASCPLAVSLAMLERHVLQPAAQREFGAKVTALEHVGTYACRNLYNRQQGRRSEHATANAIDVTAFRLSNGGRIEITRDWGDHGAAGRFLLTVHDGACDLFDTVLGPDFNAAHRTHFHMDMGRFWACR
ncbi:MAG: extensin family protein [Rhodospirillaceae bacterium]|nr:MAG: extensin family protein [Rhodospirillaceae bacterium]